MKMQATSIGAMAVVVIVLVSISSAVVSDAKCNKDDYQIEKLGILGYPEGLLPRETGKPQEKIEDEIEKASDEIQAADEAITESEEIIDSLQCDPPNNAIVLLEEAKEHLTWANEAFDDEKYGRAYGLANSAKELAQNAIENLECPELDNEELEELENEDEELVEEVENDNDELEPTNDEPLIPNDEPNIVTIWYMLASPYEVDPFVHTYILNTSGETLYNVDFKQLIPSDLQLADDSSEWVVKRYNEEWVEGTDSGTQSGTYLTKSTYTYTYKDGSTYTTTRSVSGDTVTVTYTYSTDGQTSTGTYTQSATQTWSNSYRAIWSGPTENRVYDDGYSYANLNMRGREGSAHIAETQTTTYSESSEPNKLEVSYSWEYAYVNDYLQRSYDYDWNSYSSDGTNLSVDNLGPMDMIYSLIRVIPAGEIDPNRDYCITTRVEVTTEDGKRYAVFDGATWREPFSTFKGVGAPYLGTMTLDYWESSNYRAMYYYPVMGGYVADEIVELIGTEDLWPPNAFDLSAPPDGTWTSDNTPELSWNPSGDHGFGISYYELYVDNSLDKVITDTTRTSENSSELTPGAHTWYVVAVDYAGNERQSTSTWTINIENSASISDNNLMDNYAVDNTLEENALVQENIATDNLTTENSVVDNIATVDDSTDDNTPVQEASDNSTITENVTTTQDNTSDNSTTSDNVVVQDNTADTSSTSTDATIQDDNTTTQDSTATSDTAVSDTSTSSSTQETSETSTTSDTTATQETAAESPTTTDDTTTDATSSSDTSEPNTTTDSTTTTSNTEETTSSTNDTSGTGDATTDTSTTDTSTTEETTSATSGNSAWGQSHNKGNGGG